MIVLYEYGFSDEDIKEMMGKYEALASINDFEIMERIKILKEVNCDEEAIKNIVISNPEYLNRSLSDIKNIINKLCSIGIERIDIIFESNPWLLNKDEFEIDEFIEEKKNQGMEYDDILDLIDSGMVD